MYLDKILTETTSIIYNQVETFLNTPIFADDETNRSRLEVEYSEIRKKSTKSSKSANPINNNQEEEMPVGPPVPPKPSTPIMNGERLGEYGVGGHIGNGDVVPERFVSSVFVLKFIC